MKNYICLFFLFLILGNLEKLSAQTKCEFDTLYGGIGGGRKVVELSGNNFMVAAYTEFKDSPFTLKYRSKLVKFDNCGVIKWIFNDTTIYDVPPDPIGPIEDEDHNIYLLTLAHHLIKLDANGNKIGDVKIGNNNNYLRINSFIKISSNKFLFIGAQQKSTSPYSIAGIHMTDNLGNTIFQRRYYIDSNMTSELSQIEYLKLDHKFVMVGIEDTCLFRVVTDTLGNVQSTFKKYIPESPVKITGSTFATIRIASLNADASEILYSSMNENKLYLARCDLSGNVIKDTFFTNQGRNGVLPMHGNFIIFHAYDNMILLDTNFRIIWNDPINDTMNFHRLYIYQPVYTSDGALISTGMLDYGVTLLSFYLKKSYIIKYVQSIVINGPASITVKGGQVQLIATITPMDAFNKKIQWSINDTGKASIDTTGLVTAKANGTIIVLASATDGSNVSAIKNITITNQLKYITSIVINGPNFIDQNKGQIQLTTIISPADATNKKIIWSINDTSKASIDSTGLVTAKANGTVVVTASSTDGSNVTATKNISITNQSSGVQKNDNLSRLFNVYPNPANDELNITFLFTNTKPEIELYDAKGLLIKNRQFNKINEQLYSLQLHDLPEGMYILSLNVNEMKQYQKVMVIK